MKIAIVAPLYLRIPPVAYGGTELVISGLTETLVERGYGVTLFAAGDSQTQARLIPGCAQALRGNEQSVNPAAAHLLLFDKVISHSREFDLIHSHAGWRFLPFSRFSQAPVLHTYHWPYAYRKERFLFEYYRDLNYSSISRSQQNGVDLNFVGYVYNGIDLAPIEPSFEPKTDNLIYVSRFDEKKGSHAAIELALALKKTITVIGRPEPENPQQYAYYEAKVKPLLDNKLVQFVGESQFRQKMEFLRNAKAFVFPLQWEEPFGLVLIEALAAGTPIVAYARGSVPEIVEDGVTGYIVDPGDPGDQGDRGIERLKEAVERIYALSEKEYRQMRRNCRERVEKYFTVEKMVDGYGRLYKKLVTT